MEDTKLIAKKRDLEGSSNARRMRHAGALPGVIYGAKKAPVSVELDAHSFERILNNHSNETMIIEIELEGEGDLSVLVKEVQHHPVNSTLMHVDLQRIVAGQTIQVDIEVVLVGESEGVKAGGSLDQVMHSIGVECLPKDLVDAIDVDISDLAIGSNLHVSDLGIDAKFKLLVDDTAIVCAVAGPKGEEEDADDAGTEPVVITEKNAE